MKFADLLNEGMFVIKNKDGVEKRFKSADSAEAKAWKDSSTKKVKVAVYSKKYWEDKEDADPDRVVPWTKIDAYDSNNEITHIAKSEAGGTLEDWTIGRRYEKVVDGVPCAGIVVHMLISYSKDDDLGLESDVEETQNIGIRRDVKNPKKLVFDGYK